MSKQDIATQIIYQYASMLDAKNFSDLPTIMWNDFSLTGPYELNSLEIFMGAVEQNLGAYQKTMHFIGNIERRWDRDIYTGKTYCIASHMFAENGQSKKLDMGIIYDDTIELREGVAKFINRHFNLQWQKTDLLN